MRVVSGAVGSVGIAGQSELNLMKRVCFRSVVTISITVLCLAVCLAQVTSDCEAIAEITTIVGEVDVARAGDGRWVRVTEVPLTLNELDRVRIGPESGASVQFSNGTVVMLHELTVVEIAESKDVSPGLWQRLRLFLGEVFVRVESTEQQVEFETPNVVAAVRGTTFDVVVIPDCPESPGSSVSFGAWKESSEFVTELSTVSGTVLVWNDKGAIEVCAGEKAKARRGERPQLINEVERTLNGVPEWVRRLQSKRPDEQPQMSQSDKEKGAEAEVQPDEAGRPLVQPEGGSSKDSGERPSTKDRDC